MFGNETSEDQWCSHCLRGWYFQRSLVAGWLLHISLRSVTESLLLCITIPSMAEAQLVYMGDHLRIEIKYWCYQNWAHNGHVIFFFPPLGTTGFHLLTLFVSICSWLDQALDWENFKEMFLLGFDEGTVLIENMFGKYRFVFFSSFGNQTKLLWWKSILRLFWYRDVWIEMKKILRRFAKAPKKNK